MIKSPRRYVIPDYSGQGNDLEIAVNWNKFVEDCKFIRFTIGGKYGIINRDNLIANVFALADTESDEDIDKLQKLIPTKTEKVVYVRKIARLKAKYDIKKGDDIIFEINLPVRPSDLGIR